MTTSAETPRQSNGKAEIPRKVYNGKPAGPLIIPPGETHQPGNHECEVCHRHVAPVGRRKRGKGTCKCTYYKRCTTWIDVLQSEFALKQWDRRMVAYGMGQRPDLVLAAAASDPNDVSEKSTLQSISGAAIEHAKGSAAANIGTGLHKLTERMDRGETLGYVPEPYPADLAAYERCIKDAGIEWVDIESFRVHDLFKVGGTTDRIGWLNGKLYIFDLKGLALTTPLPTPTGWTTMGTVQVGDQVFDEAGQMCNVIAKSQTKRIGTYTVSFDDGTNVVCDSEHVWWTTTQLERKNAWVHNTVAVPQPRPIAEIISTLEYRGVNNHCVPVAKSLQLPSIELPIDPYLLGCWLGDGDRDCGRITKTDDLFEVLESDGHTLGTRRADKRSAITVYRVILGLRTGLRLSNLLGHKHIPDIYFRASHEQRLRLLQGLMDTDGCWNVAHRRAVFSNADKALAHQVRDLLVTLGQRPTLSEFNTSVGGFTRRVSTAYAVEFLPVGIEPFRLPRKAAKVTAQKPVNPVYAKRRMIVSIEPGPDVETACIAVDSPSHVYLCGESMIPTHNTSPKENPLSYPHGPSMQLAMYAHSVPYVYPGDYRTKDVDQVDLRTAYIINMPAGGGRCELRPINIEKGWAACRLAFDVWAWRDTKDLIIDPSKVVDTPTFLQRSARATTESELRQLWIEAVSSCCLTEQLRQAILARVEEVKGA